MFKKDFNILKGLNPKIIFEFGAFDGTDTLSYRRSFPEATIYSFEPDPVLYGLICDQMLKNDIHFFNYAISDITGEADFYYLQGIKDRSERSPADSLFPYTGFMKQSQGDMWIFPEDTIKVNCITIFDFCKDQDVEHVDYMHIDVEGAVHKVLKGMRDIRPSLILAEVGGREHLFQGAPSLEGNNKLFAEMGYTRVGGFGADELYQLKTE